MVGSRSDLVAVFTTTSSREEARRIAAHLVQHKLAACVQISEIESVYSWKEAVQQEAEFRLIVKTTRAQYPSVEAAIVALHSYELPAIFALPVSAALDPYAAWVAENSSGGDGDQGR